MLSIWMIVTAIAVLCLSGLPACLLPSRSAAGQRLAMVLMLAGSAIGLSGVALSWSDPVPSVLGMPWFLPWGEFAVAVDAVSTVFLLPVLIVPALGSIYGMSYWKQSEHPENGRRLVCAYGLLAGSMALVVIAHDAVLFLFAIGAAAICALPPLNGFVGEWLIYSGLFQTLGLDGGPGFPVAAIAAVALAIIGALAVACFVKTWGAVFLGNCRSASVSQAHEPAASMLIPMTLMAIGCIVIGVFPMMFTGMPDKAARVWACLPAQAVSLRTAAPLEWMTVMGLALCLCVGVIVLGLRKTLSNQTERRLGTWDCGYTRASARIQYTGSSFGQMLVNLFNFILWPATERPALRTLFPAAASFKSRIPDTVLDRLILPLFRIAGRYIPWLRVLQQGQTQFYVLYILIIVVVLLIFASIGVK